MKAIDDAVDKEQKILPLSCWNKPVAGPSNGAGRKKVRSIIKTLRLTIYDSSNKASSARN